MLKLLPRWMSYLYALKDPTYPLSIVSLLLLTLVWAFVFVRAHQDKVMIEQAAVGNLQNIARTFKEHTQNTLVSADELLKIIKFHYEKSGDRDFPLLKDYFDTNVLDVQFFNQTGIIDDHGMYVFSNLKKTANKVDLSDREHFKIHLSLYPYGLFISKPVLGRVSQKWSIQVSRRMNNPDGSLKGVAVASFDPTYFTNFHKSIDLGPQGFTAMASLDGGVRTLVVGEKSQIDGALPALKVPSIINTQTMGTFVSSEVFDHVKRFYAFERLQNQPMMVLVGMSEEDALVEYKSHLRSYVIFASFMSLFIVLFSVSAIKLLRRFARINLELKSTHDELITTHANAQVVNDEKLQLTQRLTQSEKLAALGQLSAGVAHEINNPLAYVASNISSLKKYLDIYEKILDAQDPSSNPSSTASSPETLSALKAKLQFEHVKKDIHPLMKETLEGLQRVQDIIQDLKKFSRSDDTIAWQKANINQGIESTLNIVRHEFKYKADLVLELSDLPEIECVPSQLNQVFLNLIVNAAQSMDENQRGVLSVRSGVGHDGSHVWVEVQDTGCGIDQVHLSRIFDPFFTSKGVGEGTGLGLSVSHGIIQRHSGRIEVESTPGVGSRFKVILPVHQSH
jgi:signal transduction histidine kinase